MSMVFACLQLNICIQVLEPKAVSDGRFAYSSIEEISAFLSSFMAKEGFSPEQVKDFLETTLPSLERWKSS